MIAPKVVVIWFTIFWLCEGQATNGTATIEEGTAAKEETTVTKMTNGSTLNGDINSEETTTPLGKSSDPVSPQTPGKQNVTIGEGNATEGDDTDDDKLSGSQSVSGDAKTKPEDYGGKTAATTITASWQDEGFFSGRTGIIALSIAIVLILLVLVILLSFCWRRDRGGGQKSGAAGDSKKSLSKKDIDRCTCTTTETTHGHANKVKCMKDETSSLPPNVGARKKKVSKSGSAEAPSRSSDSKKELESADAPNSRVLKSEPLATSSPKAPAKQMSFAEQINIYKQLCDRFDPTPASSGTSSS